MADYRFIKSKMYAEKIVSSLTSEELLLYLYLLTNHYTNMCGCYEIQSPYIVLETRLSAETVESGLKSLEEKGLIRVSEETDEILITNWRFYNWKMPGYIKNNMYKEIEEIKDDKFREQVTQWKKEDERKDYDKKAAKENKTVLKEQNDLFDKIWALYPKKTNKSKVTEKAIKEICEIGFDRMKVCIDHYRESIDNVEDKYVMGGDTFFNGRYTDFFDDVAVDRNSGKDQERLKVRFNSVLNYIVRYFDEKAFDGKERNYLWAAVKDLPDVDSQIFELDRIKNYLDINGKQTITLKEFVEEWLNKKKVC